MSKLFPSLHLPRPFIPRMGSFALLGFIATLCLATCVADLARAAEGEGWEKPAKLLQTATVTIRISAPDTEAVEANFADDKSRDQLPTERTEASHHVSVCSGIYVAPKLLITSATVGSDSTIRVTLAGGAQAMATLRVVDEFSRLVLLEVDASPESFLNINEELPVAGAAVMTASAWGTERAIVSQGIVGAVDRTLPDLTTPALLQCDLRTTETSAGAGLVDREGKLIGVIIAADHPETKRGWAYAVPASHVKRLLRTWEEQKEAGKSVIVLPRRRPIVGVSLDGDDRGIFVRRVIPGSPAEKAGLAVGDRILSTDGVQIRSVYQALLPTMQKQPGDLMTFKIQRGMVEEEIRVVLGGGVVLPSASLQELGEVIRPQVDVRQIAKGTFATNGPGNPIKELSTAQNAPAGEQPPITAAQKIALLEKALESYRSVIEFQQRELAKRDRERVNQDQNVEALRLELERLKSSLPAASRP